MSHEPSHASITPGASLATCLVLLAALGGSANSGRGEESQTSAEAAPNDQVVAAPVVQLQLALDPNGQPVRVRVSGVVVSPAEEVVSGSGFLKDVKHRFRFTRIPKASRNPS